MERAVLVLRDLELDSLRARYKQHGSWEGEVGPDELSYFYFDHYEMAITNEEREKLRAEEKYLNEFPGIASRKFALAADGIFPAVTCYPEYGSEILVLFVQYNERGRRFLKGSGRGWSTIIQSLRKFLRIGFYVLAVPLVAAVVIERLYKHGSMTTIAALALVAAVCVLSVWFVKRLRNS